MNTGLYFIDNGEIACHAHMGVTAQTTGRTTSGQRVERVTFADRAEAATSGWALCCETCGTKGL